MIQNAIYIVFIGQGWNDYRYCPGLNQAVVIAGGKIRKCRSVFPRGTIVAIQANQRFNSHCTLLPGHFLCPISAEAGEKGLKKNRGNSAWPRIQKWEEFFSAFRQTQGNLSLMLRKQAKTPILGARSTTLPTGP
jgi:hypothetical protein